MFPKALLVLSLALLHCGRGAPSPRQAASPLDHLELSGNDGWRLRVNGDGSATLTHRQHPAHHLDYPTGFFAVAAVGRYPLDDCRGAKAGTACLTATHYHARTDTQTHCPCTASPQLLGYMTQALESMQVAVDDESSHRACRMLGRAYLAAR